MIMKKIMRFAAISTMAVYAGLTSCNSNPQVTTTEPYTFVELQKNTVSVLWNPEDFNFEKANTYQMDYYEKAGEKMKEAGACSSWRNGNFHGRNLDWYQANYACMIIQMPKGEGVKHASVSLLNANSKITHEFIEAGVLTEADKMFLPAMVVDGVNDAGVVCNINIVPNIPGKPFIGKEGDLCSQTVVRFVLDNAGSVDEAIELLKAHKIRQSIAALVGDETHYMISDSHKTAVVEFDEGEMVVTYFNETENGQYSENGNPAIMTNLYDFDVEKYGVATPEFYENSPYCMGTERWMTIKEQYANASKSVDENLKIAQSVWYCKGLLIDKQPWISENAIATSYGKDENGWWYKENDVHNPTTDCKTAQQKFFDGFMPNYWKVYEDTYGAMEDPHVKGNKYWETSHTVVYDIAAKKGYLVPFENFYGDKTQSLSPIEFSLPE